MYSIAIWKSLHSARKNGHIAISQGYNSELESPHVILVYWALFYVTVMVKILHVLYYASIQDH
jgi:hypothetical protein